jgi:hypothetical protein
MNERLLVTVARSKAAIPLTAQCDRLKDRRFCAQYRRPGLWQLRPKPAIRLSCVHPAVLTSIVANGTTAFLIILAMTFGLILPRMLFERFLPAPVRRRRPAAVPDNQSNRTF